MDAVRRGKVWCQVNDPQRRFAKVFSHLVKDYRERPEGATNTEILTLVAEHGRPNVVVIFTDGSVKRGVESAYLAGHIAEELKVLWLLRTVVLSHRPRPVCVWR